MRKGTAAVDYIMEDSREAMPIEVPVRKRNGNRNCDPQERSVMPKILLVEDNEMNRDMLSRRLQQRGIALTAHAMVSDREKAIVHSKSTSYLESIAVGCQGCPF